MEARPAAIQHHARHGRHRRDRRVGEPYAATTSTRPTAHTRAVNPGFTGVVNAIGGSITGVGMTAWAAQPAPIGSATPSTGAFTSSATSTVSGAGFTNLLAPHAPRTTRLDQFAAPNADVKLEQRRKSRTSTPINTGDAANKAYVDANATGLSRQGRDAFAPRPVRTSLFPFAND